MQRKGDSRFASPGHSARIFTKGATRPRELFETRSAILILEAATIFMAAVIFFVLPTDFMRIFTAI